jgi:hypothetical protein
MLGLFSFPLRGSFKLFGRRDSSSESSKSGRLLRFLPQCRRNSGLFGTVPELLEPGHFVVISVNQKVKFDTIAK